ncbi:hypothetical protein ACLOJK_014472 [Asimina triloba]
MGSLGSLGSLSSKMLPEMVGRAEHGAGAAAAAAGKKVVCQSFQMPLHYPRYTKSDYEAMPEWQVDCLLTQYGLPLMGDVSEKREFAMGAFLWH